MNDSLNKIFWFSNMLEKVIIVYKYLVIDKLRILKLKFDSVCVCMRPNFSKSSAYNLFLLLNNVSFIPKDGLSVSLHATNSMF